MKISRYESTHADAVWALHNLALTHAGAHGGNGPWDADLRTIEEVYLASGGEFLVGQVSGQVVAMGALKRTAERAGEVKRMRVHPSHQGQAMIEALEARAIELGWEMLTLETTTVQPVARRLYEKNGFRQGGTTRYGQFDVVLYEKKLVLG